MIVEKCEEVSFFFFSISSFISYIFNTLLFSEAIYLSIYMVFDITG